jgi:hypothetical protein
VLLIDDLDQHLGEVFRTHQTFPGQRLERDGRQRVDVASRIDRLAEQLLGRHEARGSDDHPRLGRLRVA